MDSNALTPRLLHHVVIAVALAALLTGRGSAAEWKRSLHQSSLIPSSRQPNSVAAWKVAEKQPGYAAAVASAALPASTSVELAREQQAWAGNPARFDAAHPRLGALFQAEKEALAGVPVSSLDGLLPTTPLYNYYRWRRSLDPARFDRNHPNFGPLLAEDQRVRNLPGPAPEILTPPPPVVTSPVSPPTIYPPPIGSGGGTPVGQGGGGPPPSVPEPSTFVLLAIGSGVLILLPRGNGTGPINGPRRRPSGGWWAGVGRCRGRPG